MKKILVPTDFSTNADYALDYALHLSKGYSATIVVFHAYTMLYGGFDGEARTQKLLLQQKIQAEERLEQFLVVCREKYPSQQFDGICQGGEPSDLIINATSEGSYDLIVMGSKGVTNVVDRLIGSTTAAVLDKSPIPIIAVPLTEVKSGLKRIGVFTDLHVESIDALHKAVEGLNTDAEINFYYLYESEEDVARESVNEWGFQVRETFGDPNLIFQTIKVIHIDDESVSQLSKDKQLDLLVFARTHKSFFARLFGKKSLTRQVVHHISQPVLFVPY